MVFRKVFLLTPDLERKNGITGEPFGRTELSIRASCRNFSALSSREGPVGLGIQGIPEKFDFHDVFWTFVYMVGFWNLGLRMIPSDRPRSE